MLASMTKSYTQTIKAGKRENENDGHLLSFIIR